MARILSRIGDDMKKDFENEVSAQMLCNDDTICTTALPGHIGTDNSISSGGKTSKLYHNTKSIQKANKEKIERIKSMMNESFDKNRKNVNKIMPTVKNSDTNNSDKENEQLHSNIRRTESQQMKETPGCVKRFSDTLRRKPSKSDKFQTPPSNPYMKKNFELPTQSAEIENNQFGPTNRAKQENKDDKKCFTNIEFTAKQKSKSQENISPYLPRHEFHNTNQIRENRNSNQKNRPAPGIFTSPQVDVGRSSENTIHTIPYLPQASKFDHIRENNMKSKACSEAYLEHTPKEINKNTNESAFTPLKIDSSTCRNKHEDTFEISSMKSENNRDNIHRKLQVQPCQLDCFESEQFNNDLIENNERVDLPEHSEDNVEKKSFHNHVYSTHFDEETGLSKATLETQVLRSNSIVNTVGGVGTENDFDTVHLSQPSKYSVCESHFSDAGYSNHYADGIDVSGLSCVQSDKESSGTYCVPEMISAKESENDGYMVYRNNSKSIREVGSNPQRSVGGQIDVEENSYAYERDEDYLYKIQEQIVDMQHYLTNHCDQNGDGMTMDQIEDTLRKINNSINETKELSGTVIPTFTASTCASSLDTRSVYQQYSDENISAFNNCEEVPPDNAHNLASKKENSACMHEVHSEVETLSEIQEQIFSMKGLLRSSSSADVGQVGNLLGQINEAVVTMQEINHMIET
jgi:hypothetical protein